MNIILHSERHKIESKRSAVKVIMALRRQQRSSTEQSSSLQKCERGQRSLLQIIEKSKDFSAIFTKRKRSQYSGYNQINLSKSKIIKFQQEHKINRYQTPRKYQTNLRNIAKLRKRYSLEPIKFKQGSKQFHRYFHETNNSSRKQADMNEEEVKSDRRSHIELKEIIGSISKNKYSALEKIVVSDERLNVYSERTPNNILDQKQCSLKEQQTLPETQIIKVINYDATKSPTKYNKLSFSQIKKNKIQCLYKTPMLKIEKVQQQEHLCGWQTHSFYPKSRQNFFGSLSKIEKIEKK